mmetsp:Transcript_49085/g.112591  ORF Transcript_49085/g.112591 Transcript_49085/m.112591 type:complete len:190 (-) Transcript_49085:105-674(-)
MGSLLFHFFGIIYPKVLLNKRCKLIVVTRGREGAIAMSREERWEQPTMARQVVDTTGAGDAFAAGFLWGWCQEEDVRLGLIFGCACGAAAVGQMGGSHPLSPLEINKCMLGITPSVEPSARLDRRRLQRSRSQTQPELLHSASSGDLAMAGSPTALRNAQSDFSADVGARWQLARAHGSSTSLALSNSS